MDEKTKLLLEWLKEYSENYYLEDLIDDIDFTYKQFEKQNKEKLDQIKNLGEPSASAGEPLDRCYDEVAPIKKQYDDESFDIYCPKCNIPLNHGQFNYCPNCGVKFNWRNFV